MERRYLKYLIYILEISLFILIVILGIKILNLRNQRIKGVYVTKINKDDIVFSSDSSDLKYFYEPKPNNIETWDPEWLGYEVKNTINADSLNERFDYSTQKHPNTFRIITLGDSFTFGQYVNTAENYSELLEGKLNNQINCSGIKHFDVINLGVPNYDLNYTIKRFQKRGIKYNPDLVVWLIPDTDFGRINELKIPLDKQLITEGIPPFDPVTGLYPVSEKSRRMLIEQYGDEKNTKYQEDTIFKIQNIYTGKLVILTFSTLLTKYKTIINHLLKSNVNYSSHVLDFPVNYESLRLLDHHPNEEGHKKIAEDILKYLTGKELTNCFFKK